MAFKLLSLNSLMDRTRRRKPEEYHKTDESAIVKAAAWAWYQRSNSSSEGIKATSSEVDPTRTHRHPKPSRYKLEAMRMASSQEDKGSHTDRLSLLDAYEVRSITIRLESLILESSSTHNKLCKGFVSANASLDDYGNGRMKKKKKKKIGKGIWVRHGVICSTSEEDVADAYGGRGLSSAKSVPAVHMPKCLPRAYGAL